MPRAVNDDQPVLAFAFDLGTVGAAPVSRHLMVAYDEIYSIKYFGQKLRPYWRRNGATPADLLQAAERDYPSLVRRCAEFDQDLMADLTQSGRRAVRADRRAGLPAVPGRPTASPPTPTGSRCCSPRKTPATATSPPWT